MEQKHFSPDGLQRPHVETSNEIQDKNISWRNWEKKYGDEKAEKIGEK